MTWIVLTILLGILFWIGGIGIYVVAKAKQGSAEPGSSTYDDAGFMKNVGKGIAIAAAVLWLLISAFMMVHTVGQREVAIVYNFSGTISGKRDPGVVTVAPWQHIKKENVGILHDEWVFNADNAAVSRDQQKIFAVLAINYQIDAENVVDLYKRVGPGWKTIIIDSRVPQIFKEVTSTFPTTLITEEREKLRLDTRTKLAAQLKPYDIKVVDVFVKNLGFSKEYTDAIEAKQKQQQDALRAQAKVAQVEAEARQRVAEAKGEANANIARARGEAVSNRLRQRSLTPILVQWEAIKRLNPKVTLIVCPPNQICVPNTAVPLDRTGG